MIINQAVVSGTIEEFEEVRNSGGTEYLDFTLRHQRGEYIDYIKCSLSKDNVTKALAMGQGAFVVVYGSNSCRKWKNKDGEEKNGFQKIAVFQISELTQELQPEIAF